MGGLCNRLLILESAILLGKESGKPIYLNWLKREELNCDFESLFSKPKHFTVLPEELPYLNEGGWVYRRLKRLEESFSEGGEFARKLYLMFYDMFYKKFYGIGIVFRLFVVPGPNGRCHPEISSELLLQMRSEKRTLILSSCRFFRRKEVKGIYDYVSPGTELRRVIEKVVEKFEGRVIGVHIRRTDHIVSIKNSPSIDFERIMREEIARDESVQFYLASDSQEELDHFKSIFGKRIISQENLSFGRDNLAGMKSTVVDLFVLSKANWILGSFGSTFSKLAARIGQKELRIAKRV